MDLKGLTGEIHVIPVSLMKKLRYSEVNQLVQHHPNSQTPDVSGPNSILYLEGHDSTGCIGYT